MGLVVNRNGIVLLLGISTVFVAAGAGTRLPAARVLEVQGKVTIVNPDRSDRPAATFSILYADDSLVAVKGAQITLIFRGDGHIERVAAPGKFQVAQTGCQPATGVERVTLSEPNRAVVAKISMGSQGIVQGGVVVARGVPSAGSDDAGNDDEPHVLAAPGQLRPIPESALLAAKPTFSWPAVAKAKKYSLNLYLRGSRVWSAASESPRLEYAAGEPLKSGGMYAWEVMTTLDGKEVKICEGVFYAASDRQQAEAEGLQKLLAKPETSSLALAALWYKQNRFVTEAIAVHEQLAKRSNDAAVYWTLSELCWQAGREDDAKAASNKAAELDKRAAARENYPNALLTD